MLWQCFFYTLFTSSTYYYEFGMLALVWGVIRNIGLPKRRAKMAYLDYIVAFVLQDQSYLTQILTIAMLTNSTVCIVPVFIEAVLLSAWIVNSSGQEEAKSDLEKKFNEAMQKISKSPLLQQID